MKRIAVLVSLAACAGRAPETRPVPVAPAPVPAPPPGRPVDRVSLADVGISAEDIDRNADPCDDFFRFACGGWLDRTEIPPDRPAWSTALELDRRNEAVLHEILEQAAKDPGGDPVQAKLGAYYGACMDEAAVEKAGTKAIAPLLGTIAKVRDVSTLAAAVAELHKNQIFVLFELSSVQDFKDAAKVIADVRQSGLGLPDRDYYLKEDEAAKHARAEYQAHVARTLQLLGHSAAEAKRGAADVLALESELAKTQLSRTEERDRQRIYNRLDRPGLVKAAPAMVWDNYFRALGHPELDAIIVHAPAYMETVDRLMTGVKAPAWRSYLAYHVARAEASTLPRRFVDERFHMDQVISGQKELPPRWRRCIAAVNRDLAELAAQPFVKRVFGPEARAAAEMTIHEIVKAFGRAIDGEGWMDAETQKKAQGKLAKLEFIIGYPAKWRSYDFPLDRQSYGQNHLAAQRADLAYDLAKIGKPVDRGEFELPPQTLNAYYEASRNHMVLLAGILQHPFYDVRASAAVNFGSLGMVVGHELTHGYDDQGAQFDGDGNLSGWWPEDVRARFKQRTQCVSQFYAGYEVLPGVKLNGDLTLGENIADIGGVKMAFRAHRSRSAGQARAQVAEGFSEDQQFFLGMAQAWCTKESEPYQRLAATVDRHSPARFRINGAASNVREFGEAFQCKPGARMRPANVCEVW